MNKSFLSLIFAAVFAVAPYAANASTVAVVDSGTDFAHDMLKDHAWVNKGEIAGNQVDDDHNGFVDDVNGWNFAEGYNQIFFPQHLADVDPIVFPMFKVIADQQAGVMTAADKDFYAKNITALTKDQKVALVAHLNWYGEYAHSTHCSGIIVQRNPNVTIQSDRIFPDTQPPIYHHSVSQSATDRMLLAPGAAQGLMSSGRGGFMGSIGDGLYWVAAQLTDSMFAKVGPYLTASDVSVANYSVGVSLSTIVKGVMALEGIKNPTNAQLSVEVKKAFANYNKSGLKWMSAASGTLFVIAAGNDGQDTDMFPGYPASIRTDNAITVAATQTFGSLASFSNYGATSVDVAAPGVAVMSSVPAADSNMELPLSGTSMAAPYVTGVSSAIKDANPNLTPLEMKQILMGTVDKKDWLAGKVISSGVVNEQRAVLAATLSKGMALDNAIDQARTQVADTPVVAVQPASRIEAPLELQEMAKKLVF